MQGAHGNTDLPGKFTAVDRVAHLAGQRLLDLPERVELPDRVRARCPICSHDIGKCGVDGGQQGLPHGNLDCTHLESVDDLRRNRKNLTHQPPQRILRRDARFEHLEVHTPLRPAASFDLRGENDRRVLSWRALDRVIGGTAPTHHNHRSVPFDTVEADRYTVIHRKSDGRRVRIKLGVVNPREGFGVIYVTAGKIQDDLLGGNLSHKRGEVDVERSYRTPIRIDIRKSKYLGYQTWYDRAVIHRKFLEKNFLKRKCVADQFVDQGDSRFNLLF